MVWLEGTEEKVRGNTALGGEAHGGKNVLGAHRGVLQKHFWSLVSGAGKSESAKTRKTQVDWPERTEEKVLVKR